MPLSLEFKITLKVKQNLCFFFFCGLMYNPCQNCFTVKFLILWYGGFVSYAFYANCCINTFVTRALNLPAEISSLSMVFSSHCFLESIFKSTWSTSWKSHCCSWNSCICPHAFFSCSRWVNSSFPHFISTQ